MIGEGWALGLAFAGIPLAVLVWLMAMGLPLRETWRERLYLGLVALGLASALWLNLFGFYAIFGVVSCMVAEDEPRDGFSKVFLLMLFTPLAVWLAELFGILGPVSWAYQDPIAPEFITEDYP